VYRKSGHRLALDASLRRFESYLTDQLSQFGRVLGLELRATIFIFKEDSMFKKLLEKLYDNPVSVLKGD